MAIHWEVPFVTINGELLNINIFDDSYDEDPVILHGTDSPFETKESTDDNLLKPSRISTGNINVRNENNLSGIMPTDYTSRKVTLTSSDGSILWQGYMQPQQFGIDMYIDLEEVALPVTDVLGSLENVIMDYDDHEMAMESFGELVHEAATAISSAVIEKVEFPKEWQDNGNYLGWARLSVNRFNWFEETNAENTEDEDVDLYEGMSYLELLESIAQQLGWTVSLNGKTLRFTSAATNEMCGCTLAELKQYGKGTTITPEDVTAQTWNLTSLQSSSTNNTETQIQGAKKLKIEANANGMDDLNVGVNLDNTDYVRTREITEGTIYKTRALIFRSLQKNLYLYAYQMQGSDMEEIWYDPTKDSPASNVQHITAQICKADRYKVEDVTSGDKTSYSYTDSVIVDLKLQDDTIQFGPEPLIKFTGTNMPPQNTGCIDMKFNSTGYGSVGRTYMTARLRIGKHYWNNTSQEWQTTEVNSVFTLQDGALEPNKTLDMPYEDASNYVIPINTLISGDVEFTIFATDEFMCPAIDASGVGYMLIDKLSLTYCQADTIEYKESDNISTYTAKADGYGQDSVSVSLDMATVTENLKHGFGILYYGDDMASAGTPQFLSTNYATETALLAKMKKADFRVTSQIETTIRTNTDAAPNVGEHCTWDGKTYSILSRSRTWRDNDVKLLMQEKISL